MTTVLNKQTGNMYPWITHTWNPIKGKCPHDCAYCYMKRFPQKELRLDEKSLGNIGDGNTIFVGSSTDMFADSVPYKWINRVLGHCHYFDNTYLFQTKNPKRFVEFILPEKTILGTTIETTLSGSDYRFSKAPSVDDRAIAMANLRMPKMVSIEPIMKFDIDCMVLWIKDIKPKFVSIGADSKGHNLPEPTKEEIEELVAKISKFTEVKTKSNLKRLTT